MPHKSGEEPKLIRGEADLIDDQGRVTRVEIWVIAKIWDGGRADTNDICESCAQKLVRGIDWTTLIQDTVETCGEPLFPPEMKS
jgi:hypothetical protein